MKLSSKRGIKESFQGVSLRFPTLHQFNGGLELSRHHHHAGLYADPLPYVAYVLATRFLCCGSFCRLLTEICRLLIAICRLLAAVCRLMSASRRQMSSIGRQIIPSWRQTSLSHRQVSSKAQPTQALAHYGLYAQHEGSVRTSARVSTDFLEWVCTQNRHTEPCGDLSTYVKSDLFRCSLEPILENRNLTNGVRIGIAHGILKRIPSFVS